MKCMIAIASLTVFLAGSPVGAQPSAEIEVLATIERFHAALAGGDSLGAVNVLSADVRIVESGHIQTRAEYRSGHLAADIRYAASVTRTRSPVRVVVEGDVAWATSTAESSRTGDTGVVRSTTAELMVLTRNGTEWIIRAIHWSSARR